MTKKDYVAIGNAIHEAHDWWIREWQRYSPDDKDAPFTYIVSKITDVFAADNPLFDRARFLRFVETGKDAPAAKDKNKVPFDEYGPLSCTCGHGSENHKKNGTCLVKGCTCHA